MSWPWGRIIATQVPIFVNAGHFVNVMGKELLQLNHPYML